MKNQNAGAAFLIFQKLLAENVVTAKRGTRKEHTYDNRFVI